MNIIKERNAAGFMLLNAILWGSSYIWSKTLLGYLPYFTILFLYSAGGLVLLPAFFHRRLRNMNKRTVLAGLGVGMFSVVSNTLCMLALGGTSSSNTAFIVQTSVILTPVIMSAAERKLPDRRIAASMPIAVAGLLLLTCDFRNFGFSAGDLFALGNALFFSLYLASLKIFSAKTDPAQFTFLQHVSSAAAFLALALLFDRNRVDFGGIDTIAASTLLVSVLISVTTIMIQSSAIKYVRPEKATVIYTMEPVAAAVIAFFLIGERMNGISSYAGCMLITAAVLLQFGRRRPLADRKFISRNPAASQTTGSRLKPSV